MKKNIVNQRYIWKDKVYIYVNSYQTPIQKNKKWRQS